MCECQPSGISIRKYSRNSYVYWIWLLAGVLSHGQVLAGSPARTVDLKPGEDVATVVSNTPAGTTFLFSPGTYRMQSIVPKDNDIFRGEGAAILDGSKLLEMQPDGKWWSAIEPRAKSSPAGRCAKDHPRCWMLNDLFIDNQIQVPVDSLAEIAPGRWFYDDMSGRVYISTNPIGHHVEFAVTSTAFSGLATGVEISHLVVEKYASPPQIGAIGGSLSPVDQAERSSGKMQGWSVLNTEVRWNHGAGIELGSNARIESCNVHHNGQLGIGAHGASILVLKNEIAYNNYAGYTEAWEAGGTKFALTDNLVVRSNYVHDNIGNGLWTDIDNIHTLYEGNTITNNKDEGIRHEISYDAIIRNNILRGNPSGIVISLSPNVEVYDNLVEVPTEGIDGIVIANGQRGVGAYGPHIAHDDHVRGNVIVYLGPGGRSGLSGDLATATGMIFDRNEYHIPSGGESHWKWNGPKSISDMQRMGLELHGTVSKTLPSKSDPMRKPTP